MSKSTITKLFIGSIVVVAAGVVLMVVAVLGALASGGFEVHDQDVVDFTPTGATWAMIGLGIVAMIAIAIGAIGGLVAWIGALLNTAQLEDKTWFILLLVLGLLSFGFVAMIAYVIAGPDSSRDGPRASLTIDLGRPA